MRKLRASRFQAARQLTAKQPAFISYDVIRYLYVQLPQRKRLSDGQNGEQISSAQNEDMEIEKAATSEQRKETTIPQWDTTENIDRGYEDFYKPEGYVELRINRFTKFAHSQLHRKKLHKNKCRWSASTYIRGVPWELYANLNEKKHSHENSAQSSDCKRFLGLSLYCNSECDSPTWNCRAKYTFYVVSQLENINDYKKYSNENNFCSVKNDDGQNHFVAINTLLDPKKGFIKDDTVILRAHVKAEMPHGIQKIRDVHAKTHLAFRPADKTKLFSSSSQLQSNFVLVVQGREVHVQTNFLSMHSQYFREQFAKDKSVNKAILRNVEHDEFIEMLGVIYPVRYPITAENVETIAKLAHIFKMSDLLRECEVFLVVHSNKFGRVKLLLMAHWYNLEHLQAKCFRKCKTANDLKQLQNEQEFVALDCRIKAVLLDKFVEVNTSAATPATGNNKVSDQIDVSNTRSSEILNGLVSSNSVPSDVVLVVENKRIPIHKTYLSIYSEYFKAMLMGEFQEKNQEEIVLEEVDYDDMLELLAVIYPPQSPVTEENVEAILKLADRFIMPSVLDQCKKALKYSSRMKASLKLGLAQQYNFSDLQIEYTQRYKSVEDVKKLKSEPEYSLLDVKTRALIFDSITS